MTDTTSATARTPRTSAPAFRTMLVAGAIILLHYQVLTIAQAPVTLAPVFCIALLALTRGYSSGRLNFLPLIGIDLYATVVAIVTPPASGLQFLLTALLLNFSGFVLTVVLARGQGNYGWLRRPCFLALFIVSAYSLAQWLLALNGNNSLYNPWGSHQYLHEYFYAQQFGEIRAPGFYLEPSFNALVISVLAFVLLRLSRRTTVVLAVSAIGIISTQSVAGFAALILAFLYSLVYAPAPSNARRYISVQIVRRMLVIVLAVAAIYPSLSYVGDRLGTLNDPGSSTNYRIAAPLSALKAVLATSPLGEPLGSVQSVLSHYSLELGNQVGTSLDNGLYLVVFYFGWLGIVAIFVIIAWVLSISLRSSSVAPLLILSFCIVEVVNTGGVLAPEFAALSVLVVLGLKHDSREET